MSIEVVTWGLGFALGLFGAGFSVYQYTEKKSQKAIALVQARAEEKIQHAQEMAKVLKDNSDKEIKRLSKEVHLVDTDVKNLRTEVYKNFVTKDEFKNHSKVVQGSLKEIFNRVNDLVHQVGRLSGTSESMVSQLQEQSSDE